MLTISLDEYHDNLTHTSASRLRDLMEHGAAYYHQKYVARTLTAAAPSKDMIIGQATETAVQAPDEFAARYVVQPEGLDGRTKEGKAWRELAGERTILSAEDGRVINAMSESVASTTAWLDAEHVLSEASSAWRSQASFRAEIAGVLCQARPDWVLSDGTTVDLKTCANINEFEKSIERYGYHVQAQLARRCIGKAADSFLLAVEKAQPYRCILYRLEAWMPLAETKLQHALSLLAGCQESGRWPLVWTRLIDSQPPRWLINDA